MNPDRPHPDSNPMARPLSRLHELRAWLSRMVHENNCRCPRGCHLSVNGYSYMRPPNG